MRMIGKLIGGRDNSDGGKNNEIRINSVNICKQNNEIRINSVNICKQNNVNICEFVNICKHFQWKQRLSDFSKGKTPYFVNICKHSRPLYVCMYVYFVYITLHNKKKQGYQKGGLICKHL